MTRELYRIKFDKSVTEEGVPRYMQYTVGSEGWIDGQLLTPQKITLRNKRITVTFEEGVTHNFAFTDDCELFYREIKKEDAK